MTFGQSIKFSFSGILYFIRLFLKWEQLKYYLFVLTRCHKNRNFGFRCVDIFLQFIKILKFLSILIQNMYLLFPIVELSFPARRIISQLILMKKVKKLIGWFNMRFFWELRLRCLWLFLNFLQKIIRNPVTFNLLLIK